ncbi:hypothetical protein M0813_17732 [Anaeramoeba flamelloides]|uniref:Uncharacterized protein n=1 Tax=Anaeramoeba flamelloides TaxID=1746091 RepID=A0ABQ8YUW5_9EUKA|nr:hypothetical protein M0813_17732 [Anaeramoeba flamelloides]
MKILFLALIFVSFTYGEVLWHYHIDDSVYHHVKLMNYDHTVVSTEFNPPPSAQYFNDRSGTPLWFISAKDQGDFSHDATGSLFGNKLALAGFYKDISNSTHVYATLEVYTIQGDSTTAPTPDWTWKLEGATSFLSYHSVKMTMNDEEVFLFVTKMDSFSPQMVYHAQIYIFDAATGEIKFQYDAPSGTATNDIEISLGGEIAMFNDEEQFIVVDVRQNKIMWQEDFEEGDINPFSVSKDGRVIAHGTSQLNVLTRVGNNYKLAYTVRNESELLCATAVSADSEVVVAVWINNAYNQKRIEVYTSWSPIPIHTHTLPVHEGKFEDWVVDVKLTDDGQYALIGSWGQSNSTAPTVILIERGAGIVYTYTTPGSVFDIDIIDDPENGTVYFCSAGKEVHANEWGMGGDVYCFLHQKK